MMPLPEVRRLRVATISVVAGVAITGCIATETWASAVLTNSAPQVADDARLINDASHFAKAVLTDASSHRRTADWTGALVYRGPDWSELFTRARVSPPLRQYLFLLDDSAKNTVAAKASMYQRPTSLVDIDPAILDTRTAHMGSNREQFALALADCGQADFVRTKGVDLALMAVYSNNPDYFAKCLEILNAMIKHQPLQRPGWTLTSTSSELPSGGDGVWLATNWGISGIVDMLNILGDKVPPSTRDSLKSLLRAEVAGIVRDWAEKRPWFVNSKAITSNQWIEPNIGLVKACLYLGDPALLAAYNLGVENLALTIEALGADGAFLEGVSYASMTLGPLFEVLRDLKANGDLRCHDFPFVNNAWRWMMQMQMPGQQLVNSYDSRMSSLPDWATSTPLPSLISAALSSSDPTAVPTLKGMFPKGLGSAIGIRYQAAIDESTGTGTLPNFAFFKSQEHLVWRSAWQPPSLTHQTALGIWLRGGSRRESHTHRDQGQVSIYCGNRIVLMDCGTPDYSDTEINEKYAQAAGHGIMQIGELLPRGIAVDAPVSVMQLSTSGGAVKIDTTAAYQGVKLCTREVSWTNTGVFMILDKVSLTAAAPTGTEFYRFHTGTAEYLSISGSGADWNVAWKGTLMRISADKSISVDHVDWPDATRAPYHHKVLRIFSDSSAQELTLSTKITVDLSIVN